MKLKIESIWFHILSVVLNPIVSHSNECFCVFVWILRRCLCIDYWFIIHILPSGFVAHDDLEVLGCFRIFVNMPLNWVNILPFFLCECFYQFFHTIFIPSPFAYLDSHVVFNILRRSNNFISFFSKISKFTWLFLSWLINGINKVIKLVIVILLFFLLLFLFFKRIRSASFSSSTLLGRLSIFSLLFFFLFGFFLPS